MSIEAMKLALEALCKMIPCDDVCDCSGQRAITALREALAEQPALKDECAMPEVCPEHAHAFFAKQPAHPQQELDDSLLLCASDLEHSAIYDNHVEMQSCIRSVASRIKALATPQPAQPQEPVVFITPLMEQQMFDDWCPYKGNPDPRVVWAAAVNAVNGFLLGATPQAQPTQQEPVASIFISGIGEREFDDWGHDLPVGRNILYTFPPASKPLTDEQWQAIADTLGCFITRSQKEIIEATIGIKEKNT